MSTNDSTQDPRAAKRQALLAARVVPVLRYGDAATAAYAAEVAIAAGCTTLELTWTIPGVIDLVKALRDKHGDGLLLGLGTVLGEDQAREALVAGVDFLVSPGLVPEMAALAHAASALCLTGAFTPSEVIQARRAGADMVKIFPAETGGPSHLAALKSVFPDTLFCPTGGVTEKNMGDYFRAGASLVGIGSNLYDKAAFAARDTAALVAQIARTREAAHA
ncbi:bifunctional 4-hydroxy-2-oxoglutarate aldolase/2-dehydro-3-deoxy-phosphogluconate aldolase [Bordetella genomosp. 9]|uniref:2-dehydro-3-deoxyphosphogluconate aldolase n=1 Tax=Bordetella genomosp. 9 TaxID=1416803 RepID=A0A1W6Z3F1_9BORD|nr:bifunctional 4-hydroxy-2-oxoglutarate aldolase/2-dehydro-3-deoxy-phosphogluconate aldolase [Bordetella genomosp. 9]ARP87694.1 2-dehydro-3-deoxyphosphogluconate aldolase [Bordetella genomosp. 9]ARP91664.1 2-dehydro-3-deoxyphosphogluconate aldolase [Bordetella genomosp. 9]